MADNLERWGMILMGIGAAVFGLASLASAAFESFAWSEVVIGVAALMFGLGALGSQFAQRSTRPR